MGASVEILWEADGQRLRIVEVPVYIRHFVGTMPTNPLAHGLSVLISMVQSRRRNRVPPVAEPARSADDLNRDK